MPLVSIALCTYNGEAFLERQLETLVNQTYRNVEIVISDDNSTDETLLIIQKFSDEYSFINLFKTDINLGFVKNFEKAIMHCSGDFICLCDQDDVWNLSKVERLMNDIGSCNLIYHNSNFIDENDNVIGNDTMATKYNMFSGHSPLPFLLSNCISGHAIMFKRSLVPFIIPFDEAFYHDWWIAYVAFNLKENVVYFDEVLVSYRQHGESITDNFKLKEMNANVDLDYRIPVNLGWIKKCSEFEFNKNADQIKTAYRLFKELSKGNHSIEFFIFLLRHYDLLLYKHRPDKGFISNVNYIRQLCFKKNKFKFV